MFVRAQAKNTSCSHWQLNRRSPESSSMPEESEYELLGILASLG